jgi:hypothetical protein
MMLRSNSAKTSETWPCLVNLDDLAAHPPGDLAQLALLIRRHLVDRGNSKVKNRAPHDALSR